MLFRSAYLGGIVLSSKLDLPTGAVVVWVMAVVATLLGFSIGHHVKRSTTA